MAIFNSFLYVYQRVIFHLPVITPLPTTTNDTSNIYRYYYYHYYHYSYYNYTYINIYIDTWLPLYDPSTNKVYPRVIQRLENGPIVPRSSTVAPARAFALVQRSARKAYQLRGATEQFGKLLDDCICFMKHDEQWWIRDDKTWNIMACEAYIFLKNILKK